MRQWTTPTLTLDFGDDSPDLTQYDDCIVTLKQGETVVEPTPTVAAHAVTVKLTQAQTAGFDESRPVKVQVNFLAADGTRIASNIATADVLGNLHGEAME